ncbi:MAG TPA: PH domain-containing protein [Nocardioidaceae bacterium]|nr:PH domain-containing protein [Nocardioidaceae bacterium]
MTDAPVRRLHPVSPLLRGGLFIVAWVGWVINDARNEGVNGNRIAISGGVVLLAGLALGTVSWWFTRYRVDAEEIRIESGIFVRRSRRVRIERLQAVEVQQPWLARLFGLAELSLETAGTGGDAEAKLAFLPYVEAVELRRLLLDRSGRREADVSDPLRPAADDGPVLYRALPGRLLASLVLRTGFVSAVFSVALGVALSPLIGRGIGTAVLLGAVITIGTVLIRQYLTWFGFTLRETTQGLRIRSGLLSVRSQTVPAGRVQGVVFIEPVLWRMLGWARVDVTVAGVARSGDDERQLVSALVPVASREEARALVHRLLASDPAGVPLTLAPSRARPLDPIGRRMLQVGLTDALAVTRRGRLTTRTDVVPRGKIQSVHVRQGPLQSALRLASVHLHLPVGPVAAVAEHRDQDEAWRLALALTGRQPATGPTPPAGPPPTASTPRSP